MNRNRALEQHWEEYLRYDPYADVETGAFRDKINPYDECYGEALPPPGLGRVTRVREEHDDEWEAA